MKKEVKVWLVTTDHLEDSLWFRDDEDFTVGMNYVAVQVAVSKVTVLVFILMSNHVHFISVGTRENVLAFVNGYKMRYSRYLQRKYGQKEFLRRNDVDFREIPLEEETLERAVAYVQMNCVAANICSHPTQYPWGCGNAFFCSGQQKGIELRDISVRSKRRLLHCAMDLPGGWMMGEKGYILPTSYLNFKYVEAMFRPSGIKSSFRRFLTYAALCLEKPLLETCLCLKKRKCSDSSDSVSVAMPTNWHG